MVSPVVHRTGSPITWQDYQTWPSDERWEIIDGLAYAMSPAPTTKHQKIVGNLFGHLFQSLKGKPCTPFIAPTDVRLSDLDVVQPDILVVCDPNKITASHIEGAPDVVVEVLSPATAARDQREKRALYQRAGVREYVLIHPTDLLATRYLRQADTGQFDAGTLFTATETLTFATLDQLEVPLWQVFEVPGPGDVKEPANYPAPPIASHLPNFI